MNFVENPKTPWEIKIEDPIEENKSEDKIEEGLKEFHDKIRMAKRFLEIQPLYYDTSCIWWVWSHKLKCWEMKDETDVLNKIYNAMGEDTINSKERNEIMQSLKQAGRMNKPKDIPKTWIQFKNKIVDIETEEEIESTPEYFTVNPLPYNYGDYEITPTIKKIFTEWVGEEYVDTLFEIVSYCMMPDYPLHRLFCLVGAGSNGKSKFLELISKFIGGRNICSTELDNLLNSRFEVTKLYKKLVCVMGETNFDEISKSSVLKKLTGQDRIGFEIKHKTPFDDYNYAKILISTNALPRTRDTTDGFYRRWMILDFPNKFTEEKDILKDITPDEYENLGRVCIGILSKLIKKRKFTNEGTIEERRSKYEEKSNPISIFIRDNCFKDINKDVPFWKYYEDFNDFCKINGYRILSKKEIGKELRNDGFDIITKNIKTPEGKITSWKFISGLKLKNYEYFGGFN